MGDLNKLHERMQRALDTAESRGVALTKSELAKACGVTPASVTDWFSGKSKTVKPENLLAAARALNVDLFWLIEGGADNPPPFSAKSDRSLYPTLMVRDPIGDYLHGGAINVAQLDLRASMGNGLAALDHVDIVRVARINHQELKARRVHFSKPENLRLLTGYGDSMLPTFNDGDLLLVDVGVNEIKIDAVYVMERRDELFIKRIQRRALGGFRMISDNPAYPPEDIDPERDGFAIRARVCCVWNMRNL